VYINAQAHIARFESDLAPIKNVILYLHGLYFIDPDGIDALDEIIELLEKKGIQVHICEFNKSIFTQLQESKKIAKLIEQKRVHKKLKEALAELKKSNS
jgi:MFS superfamily sulfate permease-like transporter